MAKGLLINLDRCSGCDSCIVACKLENGLDLGHFYNKVISIGPVGTFPNVEKYWLPSQCQQCKNPACVEVCPTAASYRDPKTGYVLINKEKCIGCKYCMYACPYGVRSFDKEHGCVEKCTLCSQITADGSDVPACVHNCNCGARFFGDFDDPDSDVCREMAKYPAEAIHALPDSGNAQPLTRYILSPKVASWKELV